MKRTSITIILGLLFIAVAVLFYFMSLHMPREAYLLPRLLVYVIVPLSAAMILEAFVEMSREKAKAEAQKNDTMEDQVASTGGWTAQTSLDKAVVLKGTLFVVLIAAYVFLIQSLGYFIVTPLFIVGAFWLLKSTTLVASIITAVGFSGFVYALFVVFLHLPVPMGILAGLIQ